MSPQANFYLNVKDNRFYFTLEKANRDITKLTKKVIIDKNGHKRIVYVRMGNKPKEGRKVDCSLVETEKEKSLSDRDLKRACFLFARDKFQGKLFHNTDTGRDILVSRDGLDKWFNTTKSREQSISIKKLDLILETSKQVDSKADMKHRHTVDGYTYFTNNFNINDKIYKIILLTRETHGKDSKYYYHFLSDIKIEPDSGLA